MDKSLLTSKLFWIGAVQVILGVLEGVQVGLETGAGAEQILFGVLTILMRRLTKSGALMTAKPKIGDLFR